jgi:hypothetical protein
VYSIYAKHIPNMGYPYAPYTGHSHAKDTYGHGFKQAKQRVLLMRHPSSEESLRGMVARMVVMSL